MKKGIGRRAFLQGTAASLAGLGAVELVVAAVKETDKLKPGEFTWHPERSPKGPVAIIVSIPEQLVHVYRNGIRIAVSTCSTGKPGHGTPTGVFTILQKDKHHRSSTYNNAPMPNMNRLTWSGIALHAGKLPGYPASHGCVRLPLKFSAKLFTITHIGTPVIIAGAHSDPNPLVHPGLVLANYAEHEFEDAVAHLKEKSHPADWVEKQAHPFTSVLVSGADKRIILLENGEIIAEGRATIKQPDRPLGSHVLILSKAHHGQRGLEWLAIGHHHESTSDVVSPEAGIIRRIGGDQKIIDAMTRRMHLGMMLVVTDLPAHPDTRSGQDFVIMS